MDKIDAMKAFVAVVDEGSFTKAALKLNTSNQLVSKYVGQLEEHLGTRLFNRTTRRVHPTEAGEQCFQYAKQILENIGDMEGHFGQLQKEAKGILHISAPLSFSTLHLAPLLKDFKLQHPAVGIDLQVNDRKVDLVEEGFDLALRIGRLKSSSLIAKRITPIRLVLCASPDYLRRNGKPETPADLNPEHYLSYSYMDYNMVDSPLLDALKGIQQKRQSTYISNNGEMLMQAAIASEGYAFQPTFIVGEALKRGQLELVLPEFEPEPLALYAVYPHRKLLATKLRVFMNFIDGYFGPSPYWDAFDQ